MDILTISEVQELLRAADSLYAHGWAERNGGNVSMLIIPAYEPDFYVQRSFPLTIQVPGNMAGQLLLITGTGKYLKNVSRAPESSLGLLRIREDKAELLWGLSDGGAPSSELAAHILSHSVRLNADPEHRVVLHTHATNAIAMSAVHSADEREFTLTLWRQCTEALMFLFDGVGVLPWLPCGTDEIGRLTAEKLTNRRSVLWTRHGVFGTGKTPDEALGLVEIIDKAAEIYMKTAHLPLQNEISDEQLSEMAAILQIAPRYPL
ncbi:MAG: rhamnulose-1-phosphate aldolase [Oscillospiraceae bacterium]|jgi:rhamnulose-1-phosphate aldolase|nr:rhamnulose-1-phosphate aldolase [Oscillospiraceae bacterium]